MRSTIVHNGDESETCALPFYTRDGFQHALTRGWSVSPASPPQFISSALLLIILDDFRRANFRLVRIKPDVAKGTSLAQKIPALIQLDPDLREPFPISFGMRLEPVQSMLFLDQTLNVIEDRLIFDLILHENLLEHGYDRNQCVSIVRPHQSSVNCGLPSVADELVPFGCPHIQQSLEPLTGTA